MMKYSPQVLMFEGASYSKTTHRSCQTRFYFASPVTLDESGSYSHFIIDYHEVKSRFKLFVLQSNLSGMLSYMYLIDYSSALLGGKWIALQQKLSQVCCTTILHYGPHLIKIVMVTFERQTNKSIMQTLAVQSGGL